MSSRRFPGKVLAPFRGQPLISHVLAAAERALPRAQVVVATSTGPEDDPLALYCEARGLAVFRGDRDDVFGRFRACAAAHPCDWILRLNADSPLLDPGVLEAVFAAARDDADLVTTTFPRTFPRGQNAELIRAEPFLTMDASRLTADDREHVTAVYYRRATEFRILSVRARETWTSDAGLAVDTLDDLTRLERLSPADIAAITSTFWPTSVARA